MPDPPESNPELARPLEDDEQPPADAIVRVCYHASEQPRRFIFASHQQRLPSGWYDTPDEVTGGPSYPPPEGPPPEMKKPD